ncbi:hypothetical protein [Micromonospora marina]|uniref:hypothetical protein n=1 Tax=Micromonospora marina TaxID=307120 RepID=UPI003D75AB39
MATESRHLSVHIGRPVAEVYAFAADPANLTRWAPGLGGSVVFDDGHGMSDADFDRDTALVEADLARLKAVLESAAG